MVQSKDPEQRPRGVTQRHASAGFIGHRLPGIWLRTGIAGLQSAAVWAETSSLFSLDEELGAYWDAGFV